MYKSSIFRALLNNRSKCLVVIVYVLLLLLYFSGHHQKLYRSNDNRIKYHAAPIAISTLYQGHPHDYRGWLSTEMAFQRSDKDLTDGFLQKQIAKPVDKEAGHYYWVADDRGYADIVIGAFALFGPHMKSLYNFWFLILFLSITLFVISFRKEVWAMGLLALLLLGIHSSMSFLKYKHVLVPIYEPRYLDVLSLIAVFHMLLASLSYSSKKFTKKTIVLCGQVILFILLYHARSSLGWQIVAIMTISLIATLLKRDSGKTKAPLTTIVLLTAGLLSLTCYKHFTYHKSYFENTYGVRTLWHNALMGLELKNHQPCVDDLGIAIQVVEYAKRSKACASCIEKLDPQDLQYTFGNSKTADWVLYEKCAKNLFFSLILNEKMESLKLYLYQKPYNLLMELFDQVLFFHHRKSMHHVKHSMPWKLLDLIYVTPFLVIAFFSLESLYKNRMKVGGLLLGVFLTSMIPSVAFYSDIVTHGALSALFPVLCYVILAIFYKFLEKFKLLRKFLSSCHIENQLSKDRN